jgi:hypothetical protein
LYVDQWEELCAQGAVTIKPDQTERRRADATQFVDLLLNATQSASVTVVGTVRADFYDPLIRDLGSILPRQQVTLTGIPRPELKRTIIKPASMVGLSFDPPALVDQILEDVGEDEGRLPLLQYALKESWALRKGNKITADSYARSGGVREALRTTADRTFAALSDEDQQAARQLFLRLVTPGEGREDTRALAAMPSEPTQRRIVEQFAGPRTRLLVTGSDRATRPTVEVAHETLIRTWPRLRGWIDASREKLRARTAVLQAKAEWEQQGRREDFLLPAGFQLERGRALLAEPGDITVVDIQEFIALSSARENRERKEKEEVLARTARLQRITRWAFVAVGAVILIASAAIGYLQFDKARQLATQERQLATQERQLATQEDRLILQERQLTDQANKLTTQEVAVTHGQANVLAELSATRLLRGAFDSALRLALQGTRIDLALPSDAVKGSPAAAAVAAALSAVSWRFAFGGHGGRVHSAAFSPDGSRIVTASEDSTARIWDAATAKEIAVLRGHNGPVHSATFSPDGSRLVTASEDKTARIWDAATAKEIAVLRGHEGPVYSAYFSPEASRIVTASDDKTPRIWDAATAKKIAVLRGP